MSNKTKQAPGMILPEESENASPINKDPSGRKTEKFDKSLDELLVFRDPNGGSFYLRKEYFTQESPYWLKACLATIRHAAKVKGIDIEQDPRYTDLICQGKNLYNKISESVKRTSKIGGVSLNTENPEYTGTYDSHFNSYLETDLNVLDVLAETLRIKPRVSRRQVVEECIKSSIATYKKAMARHTAKPCNYNRKSDIRIALAKLACFGKLSEAKIEKYFSEVDEIVVE